MPVHAPAKLPAPRGPRSRAGRTPRAQEPFPLSRRSRARLPVDREVARWVLLAIIAAATAFGATIRLAVTHELSVDEISSLNQVRGSFHGLIDHLIHGGVRPPLHPVLEWCSTQLLGYTSLAARLPSIVAGVALIPAAAWLAGELFDRRAAIVAACFACVAPILVWYGQEASPYELVALFGTLAVVGAARVERRGSAGDWALFTAAAALAVWSDWSGVFIVAATEVLLLVSAVSRRAAGPVPRLRGAWALSTLALACQLVPLGLLLASQIRHAGSAAGVLSVGASGVSFYSSVSNFSWALLGFHPGVVTTALSAIWPLAMLASLATIGRQLRRVEWLLMLCAVVPPIGVFVLGATTPGTFDVRYGLAGVTPLLALLARFSTGWPRGRTGRRLVIAGILALLIGALVDQQIDRNNPRRYDYSGALAGVTGHARPGDAVLYEPVNLHEAITRDAPALHVAPLTPRLPTRAQSRDVFVITSFTGRADLQKLLDRDIGALRATRHLVSFRRYPGVNVWWFR